MYHIIYLYIYKDIFILLFRNQNYVLPAKLWRRSFGTLCTFIVANFLDI